MELSKYPRDEEGRVLYTIHEGVYVSGHGGLEGGVCLSVMGWFVYHYRSSPYTILASEVNVYSICIEISDMGDDK